MRTHVSSASAINSLATTSGAPKNEFKDWNNRKAVEILYENEGLVDAADGNADKWGKKQGLINIAKDNGYSAELKTAAKYILGNQELLNKLCGDDETFGAGCDADLADYHIFSAPDLTKPVINSTLPRPTGRYKDELYFLSIDSNLSSYGGNTTVGYVG